MAEIRRVNRKVALLRASSQFMQEIGFSVATSIRPMNHPPSLPLALVYFLCSCHPAEVVSRSPLCASPPRSGERLKCARSDYRAGVRRKVTVSKLGPLRVPLKISFANKIPRVPNTSAHLSYRIEPRMRQLSHEIETDDRRKETPRKRKRERRHSRVEWHPLIFSKSISTGRATDTGLFSMGKKERI